MEEKRNKIVYVGFAFAHHKYTHAGYHQIKKYLQYDICIDGQWEYDFVYNKIELFPVLLRKLFRKIWKWRLVVTELICIILALVGKNLVFHVIYPENIIKYLPHIKGRNNKVVCTIHQPIAFFQSDERWQNTLKKVDKIILVSDKEIESWRIYLPNVTIKYIPHGIDSDFYRYEAKERRSQVLMVGNWLRNFKFANQVFCELKKRKKNVDIVVVTNEENFCHFTTSVKLMTNISDEELLLLYNTSALLFLPVYAFTANNALLEAASCGLPILIATDDKCRSSYLSENMITYESFDINNVIQKIIYKLENVDDKELFSMWVSKHYNWAYIAQVTNEYLIS